MNSFQDRLREIVEQAIVDSLGESLRGTDPGLCEAEPRFGDYQANAAMALAKKLGKKHGVATAFHAFYHNCPVLKAPEATTRAGRLVLSLAVARVIREGLGLLGIDTVERM